MSTRHNDPAQQADFKAIIAALEGQFIDVDSQVVTAAYPLDASEARIQALGLDGSAEMSGANQTAAFTLIEGVHTTVEYGAIGREVVGEDGKTYRIDSGKTAFEFQILELPNSDKVTFKTMFTGVPYSDANSYALMTSSSSEQGAGGNILEMKQPGGDFGSEFVGHVTALNAMGAGDYYLKAGSKLGIYFDAEAGKVGYTIEGFNASNEPVKEDLGLLQTIDNITGQAGHAVWFEEDGTASGSGTIKARVETFASKMQCLYPLGTRDIAGDIV